MVAYLDSGFGEIDAHGDLFAGVDVGVVRLLERPFQFLRDTSETLNGRNTTQRNILV